MPCAFGYAVAPAKTRPNISKAPLTQRGWSTAVTPSRSTLGTNKTTRTREISSEVVDERERRRTLLGTVSSQPPRPRCHPGERYATYVEAYHRDDGRHG